MFEQIGANAQLVEHSQEFDQPVVTHVTDGVHVAVGFDLANSVLIEGDEGIIIVDTLSCAEAATDVFTAFRQITDKPVSAIIYTHNHADHVMGAAVFAQADQPAIYAQETLAERVARIFNILRPVIVARSMRQFGVYLEEGGLINAGIGPVLRTNNKSTLAYQAPTHTFSDRLSTTIAGVEIELIHAPGETDDTSYVWLPEKRCLISADNIYKTFPNLYAIRGTAYRDVMKWVASLDIIREIRPDTLVPTHGPPLHGAALIYETVTAYRDAIQYVHDQTIRLMNQGLSADEIAAQLTLPAHLANHRYLREHYGTVGWSARSIFEGYLGWFSGNPTDLEPLAPYERAQRMANMVGGVDQLKKQAEQAAASGDAQWVLELTDHLMALSPDDEQVRTWRTDALIAQGAKHSSSNGRNYFLMSAQELNGFKVPSITPSAEFFRMIPIEAFFQTMRTRLDPVKSANVDSSIGYHFTDSGKAFTLHVRRGVLEVTATAAENPAATLTTTEQIWKEVAAGLRNPAETPELEISGDAGSLLQFMGLFERQ